MAEVVWLENANRKMHGRLARRLGQTRAKSRLLLAIGEGRTVPQLARRLDLSRQSVQRVADRLVDESLASYEPNPGHRRSPLLKETPLGAEVRSALDREIQRRLLSMHDLVEKDEIETALLVLRSLRAAIGR
jgi:DNA-binding MarR family transcriptional regulator